MDSRGCGSGTVTLRPNRGADGSLPYRGEGQTSARLGDCSPVKGGLAQKGRWLRPTSAFASEFLQMPIIDFFSSRTKPVVQDVWVYDQIPQILRVQVSNIIKDALPSIRGHSNGSENLYEGIADAVAH